MNKSTRIIITYVVIALLMVGDFTYLEYQTWMWQPGPWGSTLEDSLRPMLRPLLLILLPLTACSLFVQMFCDPLTCRVIRLLRYKERQAK